MTILSELITFIRRPVFTTARMPMNGQAFAELLKLLWMTFALAFFSVMIASGLYAALAGDLPEVSKDFEALSQGGQFFFAAVIIAPFTEELFFRSWLGRVWGVMLVMPILLAFSAVLALSTQSEAAPDFMLICTLIVLASAGIYVRRYHQTKGIGGVSEKTAHADITKHIFPYVFWGSAVLFGLVHMSNYAGGGFQPLLILLVIPQFIVGVVLGFVRMRYGILQAIGFHAAYNGVFVGLSLLG